MDDIRKITKADLIDFHNRYYVPNNCVAIYVGDIDPAAITAMAEKYFGRIPRGPDLEPIRDGEPPQYSEKRMYGEGPAPTSLQIMFHTPRKAIPTRRPSRSWPTSSAPAAGQAASAAAWPAAAAGPGRLPRSWSRDKQLAVNASASSRPQWYVGSFQFSATPRFDKNVQPEDLEKEIWVRDR